MKDFHIVRKFNIFTSNHLEILAEQLALIVSKSLSSVLSQEIIIVQSRGMEQWISMELARRNGICANCSFLFPNAFLQEIFKKLIPDIPEDSLFEPDVMAFKIMKLLPACTERSGFESLKTYLENDINNLKLFQVSEKIAQVFDQYLIFRPEMIFMWEEGEEDHWQAHLWRELACGNEKMHRAWLRRTLIEKIRNKPNETVKLPERISIFGISSLPPFHMQVFSEISELVDVNLFVMNPCMEYWADIVSDREIKNIRKKYTEDICIADDLHLETGNRLLASLGTMGRDFFALAGNFDCEMHELFKDQPTGSILSSIQSSILHLKDRKIETECLSEYDTSIHVHSCHSPMREIEVLHNNLLAMFEEDPDLKPEDIIVMMPDIELYSPFVHAVFDAPTNDSLRIPFSIADRSIRKESRFTDGFMSILDLKNSRFGAARILSMLELPGIKEKFGLAESDIEIIGRWIRDTRIRWGINVESRSKLGLPGFYENTWKAGIERLLLGYAMPGHGKDMFCKILPYDNIEGKEVAILGKFLEFLQSLFACADDLDRPQTLTGWHKTLVDILEQFFLSDDNVQQEIQLIRRILDDMVVKEELSGFNKKIELDIVSSYLGNRLECENSGSGFISSGVTFCAIMPMRSIPFKIICLVGMNNDAFPRDLRPLSFDLVAKNPKLGDRLRRNDDKYLFLEAIISARKKLYISYIGQSIQDNTRIPPSVLISELLDYIENSFSAPGKNILEQVVTSHKLQAFSPEYYKGNKKLFSYSGENFIASCNAYNRKYPSAFISTKLPDPAKKWKNIDIEALCFFFSNPARFMLEKRLGIYLKESGHVLEERESFALKGLEKYRIEQDLVNNNLSGINLKGFLPVERAMGRLPHGNVGDFFYSEMSADVDDFAGKINEYTKGKLMDTLEVDLEIAGFNLTGLLHNIYEHGLINIRYANTKPKDFLKSWIYHLVLCSLPAKKVIYLKKSFIICRDFTWEFSPVNKSRDILEYLFKLYWNGLSKPLHFFPESSFEYAQKVLIKNKSCLTAIKDAQKKWIGNDFIRGESEDQYFKLCFNKTDPLDEEFQKISKKVFTPLLNHCSKINLEERGRNNFRNHASQLRPLLQPIHQFSNRL